MTSQYETIIVEKERGRARITLNRPEKLNALSRRLQAELAAALHDADEDTRVHSIIIRGAGRSFCAGYDLTPERRIEGETLDERDRYTEVYRTSQAFDDDVFRMEGAQRDRMTIFDMHKPVIAQVHGYCVAGGTDLALVCDIVIAAQDAHIGFPPVRAMGGPPAHMWTYLVGPQWAKYMLLTGEFVTGIEAERIGLVWKSVPLDDLEETVEELADRLAMVPTDLLSGNKRSVNLAMELMGARTMQRLAAEMDARMHVSPSMEEWRSRNREEGLKSALEWRDGRFANPEMRRKWQDEHWPEGPRSAQS
ncbi:MAG: crotonase/enoyl-CoA hydratase family protein [Dehalococcoidia bacterium]|nr:crotonase/enoyl-CoA hydratase family protein [Dehalococcoidia bacterium]